MKTWKPCTLTKDRCIFHSLDCPGGDVVLDVESDVFAGRNKPVVDSEGLVVFSCRYCGKINSNKKCCNEVKGGPDAMFLRVLRSEIFQIIDSRPGQRFFNPTRHLERVQECLPKSAQGERHHRIECGCEACYPVRQNLTLCAVVETQASLESIPIGEALGIYYTGVNAVNFRDAELMDEVDTLILAPTDVIKAWINAGVMACNPEIIEAEESRIQQNLDAARSAAESAGVEVITIEKRE